ncbi:hypothetical protein [Arthrobacter sp. TB 26]|uniref:hypothetical protein n=1 Tax=Arthrobacter sp. TB 26 TaxID=494420 RepID=UPI0004046F26|nr:hypothetical protein [Arthrobacter sp. TB 26]
MADAARQEPAASISVRGLPDRGRVLCHGYIESVTYAPASHVAAFTAIVVDHDPPPARKSVATALPAGSDTPAAKPVAGARRQRPSVPKDRLRVVWLGRRRIPGVDAGTELRLQGMVTVRDGLPTMFNPRYEILSRQEEQ